MDIAYNCMYYPLCVWNVVLGIGFWITMDTLGYRVKEVVSVE